MAIQAFIFITILISFGRTETKTRTEFNTFHKKKEFKKKI